MSPALGAHNAAQHKRKNGHNMDSKFLFHSITTNSHQDTGKLRAQKRTDDALLDKRIDLWHLRRGGGFEINGDDKDNELTSAVTGHSMPIASM